VLDAQLHQAVVSGVELDVVDAAAMHVDRPKHWPILICFLSQRYQLTRR
jgi:hypothetical protein